MAPDETPVMPPSVKALVDRTNILTASALQQGRYDLVQMYLGSLLYTGWNSLGLEPPRGGMHEGVFARLMDGHLRPKAVEVLGERWLEGDATRIAEFQLRWAHNGFPTFDLTAGLAASLLLTEPHAPAEFFHPPFPALIVRLPWPESPLAVLDSVSAASLPARYLIFLDSACIPRAHAESDAAAKALDERFRRFPSPELRQDVRGFTAELEGFRREAEALPGMKREVSLWVVPGTSLQESIWGCGWGPEDDSNNLGEWIRKWGPEDPLKENLGGLETRSLKSALRLLVNLCLYINQSTPANLGRRLSKPMTPQECREQVKPTIWIVGEGVKLPHELRQAAAAYAERGTKPAGWKIHSRFVVRGHWRQQACGPKHAEHRLTWIEPYWKGPKDLSEAMTRQYEVREKTGEKPSA